ncbi:hypothetical protein K443DRAFT_180056 [Laccaria amethystina LaAM-08-1]|uniref:Uncharacterized protein n=1 Tax=Laccaria amethystina LaAM-08-1 TaxID=1095629 RepID=A0A0C9XTA7_9AGAR|nr:hypothetical protein K443DRAFT_180056 [Laccaria amethystina LaAM-08-1]
MLDIQERCVFMLSFAVHPERSFLNRSFLRVRNLLCLQMVICSHHFVAHSPAQVPPGVPGQPFRELLHRSGEHPLSLRVSFDEDGVVNHPIFQLLISHCMRWRTVVMELEVSDFQALTQFIRRRLSSLYSLKLVVPMPRDGHYVLEPFSIAPMLREVEIDCPRIAFSSLEAVDQIHGALYGSYQRHTGSQCIFRGELLLLLHAGHHCYPRAPRTNDPHQDHNLTSHFL